MSEQTIKAYKGFCKDMTCRDFQYKEGGKYKTEKAELCEAGFHACENPLDCFSYYSPNSGSVYHDVELSGDIHRSNSDSKIVATKIKIGARLTIADLIKDSIKFVFSRVRSSLGNCAHAATTDDYAHAATTGDYAHAATTGYGAHAATTGNYAHTATMGYGAHAEVSGQNTIAAALGRNSIARGALGCWLVLAEYAYDGQILQVRAIKIDGEKYKPGVWYALREGKIIQVVEEVK